MKSRTEVGTTCRFAKAAEKRNIELGGLVKHPGIAQQIDEHFHGLIGRSHLERLPLR